MYEAPRFESKFWTGTKLACCGGLLLFALCIGGVVWHFVGKTAAVVEQELGPDQLLRKYEWFKDAHAQLEKKRADLQLFDARIAEFTEIPREQLDRHDKAELSQLRAERIGVAASYNQLAAEYNAQMAKVNWRFCNVGDLPDGATTPLPREVAPYQTQ